MADECRRQKLEAIRSSLELDRSSFISHWKELADNFAPRRPRFVTTDKNRGDRRNQNIIDTTPVLAARALMSGMMTGITSPAREWFRLTLRDLDGLDAGPVKNWLDDTTNRMNSVFLRSNLYQVLPSVYAEIGIFGTSAMLIEKDWDNVIRCYHVPLGSYSLGLSEKLKVEVFFREFSMTVREIIQKFGRMPNGDIDWTNISDQVKNAYLQNNLNQSVDIVHAITPNEFFDEEKYESKYKKYRSEYYEKSNPYKRDGEDIFLSVKGYDHFPVLAPRWQTTGEDIYATNCPGMEALGDVKQLQLGEKRMMQAIDLMVKPPMVAPSRMRSIATGIIPGKISYVDEQPGGTQFRPLLEVQPRTQELEAKQAQVRDRIRRCFYEDIFLMISDSDRRQITAREIDERREEKLLALGPVLEQLNQDLLDPLIDVTFAFMLEMNEVEPPPTQLQGKDLKVEYISIMQQAQKLSGLGGLERFSQFLQALAQIDQTVLDKVDSSKLISDYADTTSMKAGVIRGDEEVNQMRSQRAQAQAEQQHQQMLAQSAQNVKNLSQADTSGDNAFTKLIQANQAGRIA